MPDSAGKRFKPTKYIPVSTAAALLVGSTTLFFVFTLNRSEYLQTSSLARCGESAFCSSSYTCCISAEKWSVSATPWGSANPFDAKALMRLDEDQFGVDVTVTSQLQLRWQKYKCESPPEKGEKDVVPLDIRTGNANEDAPLFFIKKTNLGQDAI
ncbi:hypothetical protein F2P81_013698 [Scophthalmus maximus]|uniref:Uncharacterized protein n=1 Tax=Scophthalmus maximus TaxID=52904 RepID=A0A6A4SU53_SCOMX|nr:hypothetical protein F2P81_013698 [Scophthalmus maximus]